MEKIIAFFMTIITFICSIFGISIGTKDVPEGVTTAQNVAYGELAREKLDIAYPASSGGTVSVVLSIHGGAWIEGDKCYYDNDTLSFAEMGYIGAQMNYTFISNTTHCDLILDEITLALQKIKSEAAAKGFTVDKYVVRGISAGGHLATLYAYSRGAESGISPAFVENKCGPNALEYISMLSTLLSTSTLGSTEYIASLISNLCGVTVTTDNLEDPTVKAALEAVSATHFIDTAVPTITCHGLIDTIVPYVNATILQGLLNNKGIENKLYTFTSSGHALSSDPDIAAEETETLHAWMAQYLTKAA